MDSLVLLGDEAAALGAIDAGISSAYGYPGTPSTETMEYLMRHQHKKGFPFAVWSANEKTAYEEALGCSYAGKRAIVIMKHVGLNVAADPFINSALLEINGGLVILVADDPGMHSSQNEQDSRYYADIARIVCLEPVNQQQAYDMTREAFDLSERFKIPVMVRLVTRISHSRSEINRKKSRSENLINKAEDKNNWLLLPSHSRRLWDKLLKDQSLFIKESHETPFNKLTLADDAKRGYITSGLGFNYFQENIEEVQEAVSHLHIGYYPIPESKIKELCKGLKEIVIIEEGMPFIERFLRGILPSDLNIRGKLDGSIPLSGELDPDTIRPAMNLKPRTTIAAGRNLPNRPPQLCKGCPHQDSYRMINEVRSIFKDSLVTSDIGCYALGAIPPYNACETIVCMGASISVAKGASEAGVEAVCAVIGDSTFYHSGMTGLLDCVANKTPVTVVILDNDTVGMTGGQDTIVKSDKLEKLVEGLGIEPEHLHSIYAHKKDHEKNCNILKKEMEYNGPSVIISVRECVETFKRKSKEKHK